ncbi:metal-dependent peptidase [[Clostridium] sordellii]|uniref:Metal-dependent peptidase n=1 Tax=Paraclostridium sordellii TaxID=1505 RepID=A0A9P1L1B3_PARSO|nr:zinc metallopeptidase [Paeniclostridium sordellii]EPZ60197.1 neutral zinc metallopeptidase family protein [[Clostridium] sordellii ATCC 9714] [Paeniclostridium sordellii ATCC 9714]EPZ57047.1 neutral zinc metallopeptidase family protein [[Clostridium] sordellii VPI 9048] [Paeniclostridium sordellii VPI 9048]MBS6023780.1 zinc metallopeptidase [Paeniclostridium sordellii]MCH1967351.1 zinc metallopeptidase [Paeniclostridium sordellii]MCQ4697486.1 zinc metallopeptidase [Paeniclostridium sordelli
MMPYYGYYGIDPTIFILIPGILFTMYAQFKVSSTTNRYFKVRSKLGYTGEQTARKILDANGLYNVRIEMVRGSLSDHYDPRSNVVRLSEDVYYGTSITSVSVAAHECGHAIQHAKGYAPLQIRSSLVPVVSFASNISWFLILIGFVMSGPFLKIGILLFSASVLFQIVTLPVEFNASRRALVQIGNEGILEGKEIKEGKDVLTAAALTYVAAALVSVLQLLRLIAISQRRDD